MEWYEYLEKFAFGSAFIVDVLEREIRWREATTCGTRVYDGASRVGVNSLDRTEEQCYGISRFRGARSLNWWLRNEDC